MTLAPALRSVGVAVVATLLWLPDAGADCVATATMTQTLNQTRQEWDVRGNGSCDDGFASHTSIYKSATENPASWGDAIADCQDAVSPCIWGGGPGPRILVSSCDADGSHTTYFKVECRKPDPAHPGLCMNDNPGFAQFTWESERKAKITAINVGAKKSNGKRDVSFGYLFQNAQAPNRLAYWSTAATLCAVTGGGTIDTFDSPEATSTPVEVAFADSTDFVVATARCCDTVMSRRAMRISKTKAASGACRPVCREKNCGPAPNGFGDPVDAGTGNMRYTEREPLPGGAAAFLRAYDSDDGVSGLFGIGWKSPLDERSVKWLYDGSTFYIIYRTNAEPLVIEHRGDGSKYVLWPEQGALPPRITENAAAGTHTLLEGSTETIFRTSDGLPLEKRDAATGRRFIMSWSNGLPTRIDDSWGHFGITISSDAVLRRINSMTVDGTALTYNYVYDSGNNLTAVNIGAQTYRTYSYVDGRIVEARDAVGRLIEQHAYDAVGRTVQSLGPSAEITNVEYGIAGRVADEQVTRVTNADGHDTLFYQRSYHEGLRTVEVANGCAKCGGYDAVYAYEGDDVVREQNARGYVTLRSWSDGRLLSEAGPYAPAGCDPSTDSARCRLTPDLLATASFSALAETVMETRAYGDTVWPDRATLIRRASVHQSAGYRDESITYDAATGRELTRTTTGWTDSPATQQGRTITTTLYNGTEGAAFTPGGSVYQTAWLSLPQPQGLPKSSDGPGTSDTTTFVYYPIDASVPALLRGHLAAISDPLGHIARSEAFDAFDNTKRTIDANGVATEYEFDLIGRPTGTTTKAVAGCDTTADPLCATDLVTTRTYDPAVGGPLLRETSATGGVVEYGYDARGRVQTISRGASSTNLVERMEWTWGALSGEKEMERYLEKVGATWTERRRENYTYATGGELASITHPDATSSANVYGPAGELLSVRDENHGTPNTRYEYDAAGRLKTVRQTLAGASGGEIVTTYAYDLHGNLTSVTDPNGNVTTYVYDDFGQMLSQTSPVTGTTGYAYDINGNLMSTTDANGATTTRTYDAMGRVTSAVSALGWSSETVNWTYDDTASGAFGIGRLTGMTDPSGSTTYAYDRRGVVRRELKTIDSNAFTTAYRYDASGNRSSITYPSGRVVNYTFDFAGRPLSASTATTTYVSSATYLPFGPSTQIAYGNATTRTRTYDARYRPTMNRLSGPSSTIAESTYQYDSAGNITQINDALSAGFNRTFAYDDLHRLVTANTGVALWGTGSYTYDRMGNMLTSVLGTTTRTFTYQGTTPKISTATGLASSMTYDAAGNELKSPAGPPDGSIAATYSPRNLLATQFVRQYDACVARGEQCFVPEWVQVSHSNTYDGRGVRVMSVETEFSGTISEEPPPPVPQFYFYTPELAMLNINAPTSGRTADVIWFGGEPVVDHDATTVRYTHTDHLGTPILQTNTSASVVWRVEHEPFGTVYTTRTGTRDDQPLRFPGQQVAYATTAGEEMYNIFRWYRGGWGRYTQADPLGLGPDINVYRYANSNPISIDDPFGLDTAGCDEVGKYAVNETPCRAECCAQHDRCYDVNHCSSGSWPKSTPKTPCDKAPGCRKCNADVKDCFKTCLRKELFHTKDDPKKPNYYCGAQHRFIRIPGDFPNINAARKACECDYSKACPLVSRPSTPTVPKSRP
jgi:RHS repeat-associated protein